uniref:Protein phosphatase 1 regulatory inhibitor subunit 16B n=1 Tax=Geotrypetes seraphini TaxID=260995 RepID=A0A6P8P3L2_GEOSA|nr:protein phosphatase 1 regulatory inhibitor subunit 16B [Geotrypetes seraphini]XP_033770055.1 protein phosphatase 1 regulatory inhibitor subunit 16B [Geotrypetes seraphini]XP_033770056.1 protein phosphatase 1 regulatory inhibitor subunit 16B [Geotrypetes seraphini]XP_033770058.1 protein phosphatase 1 regulatory inhibitor subunit 16B [Geotrypetes seraphini]
MANPVDLLTELQLLEKAPTLERLRAAQKRRAQQLKRWAQYEKELQNKKRKHEKKRATTSRKKVSFEASVTLLEASQRNDVEEVCKLLNNKVDPNLCNEDGLTSLHQCCIDNFEEIIKLLLSHGANANARDNELWTPLHAAATCGHINLVRLLMQHGADLLAVNADGNMPYDLCEDEPTLDFIETCMAYQGITQEKINEMRAAPEQQMISNIRDLIADGQDLNAVNEGAALLHIAGAHGYIRAAEILLEHGAKVDIKDWEDWEPLHAAAFWGQMQMAELLVSHGASLSARTALDETPLDLCEDDEFKAFLLELKHKHDVIMKSQQKHKSSLSRRTSSAGSRGKVVRRASLSDRTNLYRREYETEAIVWQRMGSEEEPSSSGHGGDDRETSSDQENREPEESPAGEKSSPQTKPTIKTRDGDCDTSLQNGFRFPDISFQYSVPGRDALTLHGPPEGTVIPALPYPDAKQLWRGHKECSHQTLSELKRQRAAAKLLHHPLLNSIGTMAESGGEAKSQLMGSRTPTCYSNGMAVYYTTSSGDPPLLKFKAPAEDMEEKVHGCCRIS